MPWEQATVHVLSHSLHYGSSVFEGIRVYKTPRGADWLPVDRPHSAALQLGENLSDQDAVHARRAHRSVQGRSPRERLARRRIHPPDRVPRLRRARRRAATSSSRRFARSRHGNGARTSAPTRSSRASMFASPHGSESHRTPCRGSRRPAAITCRAFS